MERRVLEVGLRSGDSGMYGFLLAQELAGGSGETRLVAHGTLYKALDRLRRAGLLEAEWEDADERSRRLAGRGGACIGLLLPALPRLLRHRPPASPLDVWARRRCESPAAVGGRPGGLVGAPVHQGSPAR